MRKVKLKKEQYLRRRRRSKKPFPVKGEYRLCIFKSGNGCLTGYYFHVRSDQAS